MRFITLILLCSALAAQEPKPKTGPIAHDGVAMHDPVGALTDKPKTPPAIPAETSARFWQAQAQLISAQAAVDSIKAELAVFCGADYFWDVGKADKPVCVAKPETPKPPAPKPEAAKPAAK